jgi:hypothetical protein
METCDRTWKTNGPGLPRYIYIRRVGLVCFPGKPSSTGLIHRQFRFVLPLSAAIAAAARRRETAHPDRLGFAVDSSSARPAAEAVGLGLRSIDGQRERQAGGHRGRRDGRGWARPRAARVLDGLRRRSKGWGRSGRFVLAGKPPAAAFAAHVRAPGQSDRSIT